MAAHDRARLYNECDIYRVCVISRGRLRVLILFMFKAHLVKSCQSRYETLHHYVVPAKAWKQSPGQNGMKTAAGKIWRQNGARRALLCARRGWNLTTRAVLKKD